MPALFSDLSLRDLELPNRLAVSPMCQYSCEDDGLPTEWHRVHLGSRAVGGAGIVMTEATAVEPRGRITPGDLGIWSDEHATALEPITEFIRDQGGFQRSNSHTRVTKRASESPGTETHRFRPTRAAGRFCPRLLLPIRRSMATGPK